MRKTFIFILALFAVASVARAEINFPEPVAWIDFSEETSLNTTLQETENSGAEAFTESIVFEGVTCRKIPRNKFMYLKFDREAIPDTENNILISVTYYDNNGNDFWFNYNSPTNDYHGADFKKGNSKGWATTIITLTNAQLNGKMGGNDIRLGHNGGDNYVKEIKVAIGSFNPDDEPVPAQINRPENQFTGRSFAGYQIWHQAGPNAADWVHWSYGHVPGPGFHLYRGVDVSSYPDVSEYEDDVLYDTRLGALGNGREAGLYNSQDAAIIDKQMKWLEDVDFDGVAVQRFVGGIGKSLTISEKSHLSNVKNACEATGRLFYICYDLNGSDATIVERMKKDWVYEIEQIRGLTSSPNYATVEGKPVVEIWGIGMDMATAQQNLDMINFLKERGCYVIGGTPRDWRTSPKAGYADVFKALNCVSPWTIGAYSNVSGANSYRSGFMNGDKTYCDQNGIDYLPVVFAGSANWLNDSGSFSQTFRLGGELFWAQIKNAKEIGVTSVYYAMLDEFEESTNLIKGAVDYFDLPVNQYFETFSRDGIWVSSDYYLRLSAHASKVLRGEEEFTTEIPVPYSEGPIFYRNSFESRLSTINKNGGSKGNGQKADYERVLPLDPCFYKASQKIKTNIANASCAIKETEFANSGNYSALFAGEPTSDETATYSYKFAEVKISVKKGMRISYWKYIQNELDLYTAIDFAFKSGENTVTRIIATDDDKINLVGKWVKITRAIDSEDFIGKVITELRFTYNHPATSGSFNTYFDDIIIYDGSGEPPFVGITQPFYQEDNTIVYPENGEIIIRTLSENASIAIYNISGQKIYQQKNNRFYTSVPVEKGIYIVVINDNGKIERKKVIVP